MNKTNNNPSISGTTILLGEATRLRIIHVKNKHQNRGRSVLWGKTNTQGRGITAPGEWAHREGGTGARPESVRQLATRDFHGTVGSVQRMFRTPGRAKD